jgi:hypothetical protein
VFAAGVMLTSDRNSKENFAAVDPREVLRKVAALPITTWNYKNDDSGNMHLGPVAQDFHQAFGLNGKSDTVISSIDEAGVALAAIQGLHAELQAKAAEIDTLRRNVDLDQARINRLESQMAELQAIARSNGFTISPTAGIGAGIGLGVLGLAWLRRRNPGQSARRQS